MKEISEQHYKVAEMTRDLIGWLRYIQPDLEERDPFWRLLGEAVDKLPEREEENESSL
jgi:hypothetical protein